MVCMTSLLSYIINILAATKRFIVKDSNSLALQLACSETDIGMKDRTDNEWDDDVNTEDEDSTGEESVR